jgi:hypothetical protein
MWRSWHPVHFFKRRTWEESAYDEDTGETTYHNHAHTVVRLKSFLKDDAIAWKLQFREFNRWKDIRKGRSTYKGTMNQPDLYVEELYRDPDIAKHAYETLCEQLNGYYNDYSTHNKCFLKDRKAEDDVIALVQDFEDNHGEDFYQTEDGRERLINNKSRFECTKSELFQDRDKRLKSFRYRT